MRINTDLASYYGIGDLVTLGWVAEGTRKTRDPISFHAEPGLKSNVLQLLRQKVAHCPGDRGTCVSAASALEMQDGGRKRRVDYLREFLGLATPVVRPKVSVSAKDLAWAEKIRSNIGGDDLVVVFPQTDDVSSQWVPGFWIDVGWQLNALNVKSAAVLARKDERYASMPHFFWGVPPGQSAALISLATLVVTVDNGAAHLAGTIGVPTIVLTGPTRPACAFGHIPEVKPLTSHGELDCAGCHFQHPFRHACHAGCQVLYALQPQTVLAKIVSELSLVRRGPRGRRLSLVVRESNAT